ncbi:MAG: cytochrome P450 [Halioglobus sp.]
MASTDPTPRAYPPGPATPYDLDTTEESFPRVAEFIAEYGDICRIKPVSRSADSVLINDPDVIKYILVRNHENYKKGPGFERVKMLLGNGIIVSDGSHWRKQRRMIQPAFSRSCIAGMTQMMQDCNRALALKWQRSADLGLEVDVTGQMCELSLEIILRALFSKDLDSVREEDGSNPFSMLSEDTARDIQLVIRFRALRKVVQQFIARRRESDNSYEDFLDAFMKAKDKDSGEGMTDGEIIDEVMTLIIAGHETSATTLNWAWYLLSQNPGAEEALHAELTEVMQGEVPTFEEVGQLSFTRSIIEETMRLYPPVWLFSRTALADDEFAGFHIPAGTHIFFTPYYTHRHRDHWKDPESFEPLRFSAEAVKSRHNFAFIPFSAGPRRCIGDYFSIVEMQIHLATMAKKFRMEKADALPIELAPQINLRSKNPITMKLIPR